MTRRQAHQLLSPLMASVASTLGFMPRDAHAYARPANDATAVLSFPHRLSPRGVVAFSAIVGLRFEKLAPWLDDDPAEQRSTFGMPLNLLRPDKSFTEWELSTTNDIERLRAPILNDLQTHALPFIDRHSRLSELRKTLESPDPTAWINIGLTADRRVLTLAALQLSDGDKSGAIQTLTDGLKSLEDSLANKPAELRKRELVKHGFAIKSLRNRLLETR